MKKLACIRFVRALRVAVFGLPRCRHRWNVRSDENIHRDGKRIGHLYVLQCARCGSLKERWVY